MNGPMIPPPFDTNLRPPSWLLPGTGSPPLVIDVGYNDGSDDGNSDVDASFVSAASEEQEEGKERLDFSDVNDESMGGSNSVLKLHTSI